MDCGRGANLSLATGFSAAEAQRKRCYTEGHFPMTLAAPPPAVKSSARLLNRLQWLYILFLFGANVFRAATQSITSDEAWMHQLYLKGHFADLYGPYDAANHVLHTLACYVALKWFGFHDFVFRIPSLLGGLAYLIGCVHLCRWAVPKTLYSTVTLVWLTLNPFVLDYLVAARGYGTALAFFTWALYFAAKGLSGPRNYLRRIGYFSGLAAAANLVFAVPVCALCLAVAALWIIRAQRRGHSVSQAAWRLVHDLFLPACVLLFVFDALPLSSALPERFYFGASSAAQAVASLVNASLRYRLPSFALRSFGQEFYTLVLRIGSHPILIALASVPAVALGFRRSFSDLATPSRMVLLLSTASGALAAVFLFAAHSWFGVPYPLERTGIYIVFLLGIAVGAAACEYASLRQTRFVGLLLISILGTEAMLFAAEWNTRYFKMWQYDAGMRDTMQAIRQRGSKHDNSNVRIGATWECAAALNYYRRQYRMGSWVDPVTDANPEGGYDYYVLLPRDQTLLLTRHLRVLYRNPISEQILAVP